MPAPTNTPTKHQPELAADEAAGLSTGPWLAMVGAVAFSGKAIIVKLSYQHGADAVTVIMLRMAVALPFFLLMAWWAGRHLPALGWRDRSIAAALGFTG